MSAVASSKSSGECSPEVAAVESSRAQLRSSSRSKDASERDAGRTVASVGPCACVWMQEARPSRSEVGGRTAAADIAKRRKRDYLGGIPAAGGLAWGSSHDFAARTYPCRDAFQRVYRYALSSSRLPSCHLGRRGASSSNLSVRGLRQILFFSF